jgi:hypothetical protein
MFGGRVGIATATKILVIASWLLAAATEIWLGTGLSPALRAAAPWLFIAGFVAARLNDRATLALLLALLPLAPALIVAATGRFYVHQFAWWSAVFGGALLGRLRCRGWTLPPAWQVPLGVWAVTIAVTWPLIALRECDWALSNLDVPRLHNTSTGIFPTIILAWIASSAHVVLLGILWIDRMSGTEERHTAARRFVLPLVAGGALAMPLAIYQGWFDLRFFSVGIWPEIGRAVGTLMDANAFGIAAALWGAVATTGRTRWRWLVYAASWAAVWATGSRTAFLAAAVAGFFVARAHTGRVGSRSIGRLALAAAVLLAAVVGLHRFAPTASPLSRISGMIPELSPAGAMSVARALWERDSYGTAAVRMIREHPLAGVGIGAFNTLVIDYSKESKTPAPPDNAQNWFRHQMAETGVLGSAGWILWLAVLIPGLRAWQGREAIVVKGALLAFALASLVGMPSQNLAVALTVCTLIGWAADGARREWERRPGLFVTTLAAIAPVAAFAITLSSGLHELRVPFRAARFDFNYSHGFDLGNPDRIWAAARAVAVPRAADNWMHLTYWVEHPDADATRVQVDIWRDRERVASRKLSRGVPVTEYVRVEKGRRFVLEVQVDRTFVDAAHLERGVAMRWDFLASRR